MSSGNGGEGVKGSHLTDGEEKTGGGSFQTGLSNFNKGKGKNSRGDLCLC